MKQRIWSNGAPDSGAVHCLGNGDFLVYEQVPVISQIQGPPYTAPSFCRIGLQSEIPVQCVSEHKPQTVLWEHRIRSEAGQTAVFTDGMLPGRAVFFRFFRSELPLCLPLEPLKAVRVRSMPQLCPGRDCLALQLPAGTNFFTALAVEQESWLLISGDGISLEPDCIRLTDSGRLIFSAGSLPDAVRNLNAALAASPEALSDEVNAYWRSFFAGVTDLGAQLPGELPESLRRQVSDACFSVAALIKCQQSRSGGVIAGHPYPLGYVRDMAGTLRGMLALGMKQEAAAVLRFWKDRFAMFGDVHNAEGMGHQSARLIFPNDETELPAYLILSAFHYADSTGDAEMLTELWPMLRWAFTVQLGQLSGGMMGFSGDETYIAGGTLPRVHTHDGSAEATLLFRESGERFLRTAQENGAEDPERLRAWKAALNTVEERYRSNFMEGGLLYANNPDRLNFIARPEFAHGFCEAEDILEHRLVLGWTVYDPESGYYCCPDCLGKPHENIHDRKKRHLLSSVSLLPAFYQSTLLTGEEIASAARPYIDLFERNGFVPSNAEGDRALGYDSGLFLAALSRLRHPKRVEALQSMLDMLDETGAWVEYYDRGVPANCRCRPWESGVNIEAIRLLVCSFCG